MLSIVASSSIQQCHNDDDGDSNCPCQPHDDDNGLNKRLAANHMMMMMIVQVNHMMRRLKLNFYRAEDEMFIMKKKQWRVYFYICLCTIFLYLSTIF